MKGVFIILACWLAGNGLSMVIDGYISGNIIGMLLLFTLLCTGVVKGESVRLLPVAPPPATTVDRVIEMVPEVVDKVTDFVEKQLEKKAAEKSEL